MTRITILEQKLVQLQEKRNEAGLDRKSVV